MKQKCSVSIDIHTSNLHLFLNGWVLCSHSIQKSSHQSSLSLSYLHWKLFLSSFSLWSWQKAPIWIFCSRVEINRHWTLRAQEVCLYVISEEMSKHRGFLGMCSWFVPMHFMWCISGLEQTILVHWYLSLVNLKLHLGKICSGEGKQWKLSTWPFGLQN